MPRRPRDLVSPPPSCPPAVRRPILPSPPSQLALHRPQRPRAPPSAHHPDPQAGWRGPTQCRAPAVPPPAGGAQRTACPRRIQPRPPQSPALVTLRRRARIPRGPPRPTPPPGRVRPSADPGPSGPISPHYILSDTTGDMTDQKSVQPDRNL